MAVKRKLNGFIRDKRGSASIEFIMVTAMLILIFATLVTAMVYITQYYSASYICRRVVRSIEVTGEYNEQEVYDLAEELGGHSMDDLTITVDAPFFSGNHIQMRDEFNVALEANYPVTVFMLGSDAYQIHLPIQVSLSGRSEVYFK